MGKNLQEILNQLLKVEVSIEYHDTKFSMGCPNMFVVVPDEMYGYHYEINYDLNVSYWDCDLSINDTKFPSITTNFSETFEFDSYFHSLYSNLKDLISKNYQTGNKDDIRKDDLMLFQFEIKEYLKHFYSRIIPFDTNLADSKILCNRENKIVVEPESKHVISWISEYYISKYLKGQKEYLEHTLTYIEKIFELGGITPQMDIDADIYSKLSWKATDTDLLELIVALIETNSVLLNDSKLSRKELVRNFEQIFSINLKDFESKLTRATERKKDTSPYLTKLKLAFDNYCERKLDRQE